MSGIGSRTWYRGRGGIYRPDGRIVPATQGALTYEFPADSFGIWNPYETASNAYTPGGTYTQLDDQTGAGRHMVVVGSAPDASALIFPGKDGLTSLPQCASTRRLRYKAGANSDLQSFAMVYAGAYSTNVGNTGSEYQLNWGNVVQGLLSLNQGASSDRQLDFSSVGGFGPVISGIPPAGNSVNAWLSYAIRCEWDGITGSTASWRLIIIGDMDDGSGAQLFTDSEFTESSTTAATPADHRSRFRGLTNGGTGDKGVVGLWQLGLDDASLTTGYLAAISNIGSSQAAAAAALL